MPRRGAGGSVAGHASRDLDLERSTDARVHGAATGGHAMSRIGRRAERWFLGTVMGVLAYLVERRVLRALKRSR